MQSLTKTSFCDFIDRDGQTETGGQMETDIQVERDSQIERSSRDDQIERDDLSNTVPTTVRFSKPRLQIVRSSVATPIESPSSSVNALRGSSFAATCPPPYSWHSQPTRSANYFHVTSPPPLHSPLPQITSALFSPAYSLQPSSTGPSVDEPSMSPVPSIRSSRIRLQLAHKNCGEINSKRVLPSPPVSLPVDNREDDQGGGNDWEGEDEDAGEGDREGDSDSEVINITNDILPALSMA